LCQFRGGVLGRALRVQSVSQFALVLAQRVEEPDKPFQTSWR